MVIVYKKLRRWQRCCSRGLCRGNNCFCCGGGRLGHNRYRAATGSKHHAGENQHAKQN